MFRNYRIPRENLLSKTGDMKPDGNFVTTIKDSRKRLGASLGALSAGRVNICGKMEFLRSFEYVDRFNL